jgi:hypothetical protein
MNALVKVPASAVEPVSTPGTGVSLYRVSTDAAALCRDIVVATASNIQGRRYVQVEGWQAIALAHGCAASSGDVTRHHDGSISATGRVIRIDTGTVIASAEGYVGADEQTWFGGTVTDRWGKTKTLPKRADYAIRAMAQTRAISRACRSAFAHVVVMMNAGLSTTPAEEVPDGGFEDAPPRREAQKKDSPTPQAAEPKKPTITEWLDALDAELAAATTAESVDAITSRTDVQAALDKLQNGARTRLNAMCKAAIDRTAPPQASPNVPPDDAPGGDDGWPGPTP